MANGKMTKTLPNKRNFCGGNFSDWLEVNLLNRCNGICSWCVEKKGFHPDKYIGWKELCDIALSTGKQNIILLGGEPTLHSNIKDIVAYLSLSRNVWITTNGSRLTKKFVSKNLYGVKGINVSIHSFSLGDNKNITGIRLKSDNLIESICELHNIGATVRFNCNCISGYIDSIDNVRRYIQFAKSMGADSIRFAELKFDENNFVNLAEIFNYQYGLNDDPYKLGCNTDCIIDGMTINFRQMCGQQTKLRPFPPNPRQTIKKVLYYDGIIYNGWQQERKMTDKELISILEMVANGAISIAEAALRISRAMNSLKESASESSGGCVY